VAFFSRKITTAEFASSPIKAAAGVGISGIPPMYAWSSGTFEQIALSLPTVSRARDLLASTISGLEFRQYVKQWDPASEEYEEIYVPNESWMENPDPKVPRQFILSNTFTDLWLYGRAFWAVTSRNATDGRPMSFEWLPAASIQTPSMQGPQFFGMPDQIQFNGNPLDPNEIICFLAPTTGLVFSGQRAVNIAIHLDQFADRAATIETVPGYLQQTSAGETMSGEELGDLASQWAQARKAGNVIGALNNFVEFKEFNHDPLEVNAAQRQYQALDLSRLCSVPAYLVSAPTPGASMTYQNATQARQDLWLFGAQMYAEAITQRLSMNDVTSRGRFICFDTDDLLAVAEMADVPVEPPVNMPQEMPS
jgi:hypothetical protein